MGVKINKKYLPYAAPTGSVLSICMWIMLYKIIKDPDISVHFSLMEKALYGTGTLMFSNATTALSYMAIKKYD